MPDLDEHSALPKEKLLQGRGRKQSPCLCFSAVFHTAQLQSSGPSNSLMSPEVLGFRSSLSCFSTYFLLSPHTLNCTLSFTCTCKAPGAVQTQRLALRSWSLCGLMGKRYGEKKSCLLNGARTVGCGGTGAVRNRSRASKGAFEHSVPHLSPSSSVSSCFSLPWGYSSHTGFPWFGKRERSWTFPVRRLSFVL